MGTTKNSGKGLISPYGVGEKRAGVREFFACLGMAVLSSFLFAASFPNLFIENGIPLLAWIAYVPIFILIHRVSLRAAPCWGALYGYAAYGLFNYWLSVFHPLAGIIVGSVYLVYLAILFFILKLADILFPRRSYLVQWIIWLAYEYIRTKGFLGYSYGITGYSQWRVIPLIQTAALFGVWGVSALVVFSSTWLGAALRNWSVTEGLSGIGRAVRGFFSAEKIAALIWAAALAAALLFGFVSRTDYSSFPTARIALIQHNTDPWKPSKAPTSTQAIEEYRNDFRILKRLSDEALAAEPKPDMVVWSETAFVPRIYWHETYRDDPASWALVKELLDYLAGQDLPFVIGNDDARKDPARNPNPYDDYRIDYNAVMLFEKGKISQTYRKLHLVPFTEYFPYEKQLPLIYRALEQADTHFWEKGGEATVFPGPGFAFSTPICFEDTFGYLSRNFARNGAEVIVNLTNDAWAKSLPAQNQHLSMAVFRAVENHRSLVRSTASGQTCAVDPSGAVIAMAPPFSEAWITVTVPIVKEETIYTRYGDFLGQGFVAVAVFLLLFGIGAYIIRKRKRP
ncbi:MAG: apolipoprotein N-acyltransferase [Treponema sp.]|jgi:apolipoprotein N-acyltransferase|nr:apolipoprotein N-acyltransferase [Treponema sp.]